MAREAATCADRRLRVAALFGGLVMLFSAWALGSGNVGGGLVTSRAALRPTYGSSVPAKNERRVDPATGVAIVRVSDHRELVPASSYGLVVYGRYTPVNTSGELVLVHHDDSTSASLYRVADGENLGAIKRDPWHAIGEVNEIRWDYSGAHPGRVYFVSGMCFYSMELPGENGRPTLIHDFSRDFPGAVQIMNDVEGDSSNDSRYWSWQVLDAYKEGAFPRRAFIVYDRSRDAIVGSLRPQDVGRSGELPKPNMVEVSPLGSKVVLHFGAASDHPCRLTGHWSAQGNGIWLLRGYLTFTAGNSAFSVVTVDGVTLARAGGSGSGGAADLAGQNQYANNRADNLFWLRLPAGVDPNRAKVVANWGVRPEDVGSAFDGPHAFDLDFSHPVRIAADETHSGWAFGLDGREWFVSQNNKTDWIEARDILSGRSINILRHATLGWGNGFHFSKFYSPAQRGWLVMNTTSKKNDVWGENQILMVQLKPEVEHPLIWRVSPKYSAYAGSYRDESPVALGYDGHSLWYTSNWGVPNATGEVYRTELPADWLARLARQADSRRKD